MQGLQWRGLNAFVVDVGHSCWGILNAPATGEAIADMIIGQTPKVNMEEFSPARFVGKSKRRR